MTWFEYIRKQIERIIPEDLPVYFWWDFKTATEKKYVVYQTENLNQKRKRRTDWYKFMDRAVKVYDYSTMNKQYYPGEFLPLYPEKSKSNCGNEIEVLFYGLVTPRREKIINNLGAMLIKTKDMNEIQKYIKRSKFVLSAGCYDNVYADPLRICPALNIGANIIMERTKETWLEDYLLNNMTERIKLL